MEVSPFRPAPFPEHRNLSFNGKTFPLRPLQLCVSLTLPFISPGDTSIAFHPRMALHVYRTNLPVRP